MGVYKSPRDRLFRKAFFRRCLALPFKYADPANNLLGADKNAPDPGDLLQVGAGGGEAVKELPCGQDLDPFNLDEGQQMTVP